MILVYQILTGKIRIDSTRLFTLAPADQGTRGHALKLSKPTANRVLRQNFFSVRVVNQWNSLPNDVVTASSTNVFKNKLDKHWQDKMYKIRGEI
mgnify:CR=1 FL=1